MCHEPLIPIPWGPYAGKDGDAEGQEVKAAPSAPGGVITSLSAAHEMLKPAEAAVITPSQTQSSHLGCMCRQERQRGDRGEAGSRDVGTWAPGSPVAPAPTCSH